MRGGKLGRWLSAAGALPVCMAATSAMEKDQSGRTLHVSREVYDFDRQTVRGEPDHGDTCHHRGR